MVVIDIGRQVSNPIEIGNEPCRAEHQEQKQKSRSLNSHEVLGKKRINTNDSSVLTDFAIFCVNVLAADRSVVADCDSYDEERTLNIPVWIDNGRKYLSHAHHTQEDFVITCKLVKCRYAKNDRKKGKINRPIWCDDYFSLLKWIIRTRPTNFGLPFLA